MLSSIRMKSLLGKVRRPDVIFRDDGHFDLTARVVRELNIGPGDVVDVLNDGCEYYLYVRCHASQTSGGRFEAQVFPSNRKGGKHYRGSSARLCKAILSISGATKKVCLPCGTAITDSEGRCLLPIIVRLNLTER